MQKIGAEGNRDLFRQERHTSALFLGLSIWGVVLFCASRIDAQIYQTPFKDQKLEMIASMVFWSGAQIFDLVNPAEVLDEYRDIDPKYLWAVDRQVIGQNSLLADKWSDGTLYASIASPFMITLLHRSIKEEASAVIWMGLQGYFVENGINKMVKILAERPRPYIYHRGEQVLNTTIPKNGTKSFFSGHASSAAYFSFFAAKVFSDTHPESKLRPYVWALASGLSGATAYLRTKAGKHFYSDVMVGWVFGAAMGILIPELHRNDSLSLEVQADGLAFCIRL